MSMDRYVPEIQEKLRQRYPWFQHSKVQELMLQAQAVPTVNFSDRYEFLQRDKRTGVVLTSNSIAFHTNKYSSYETFEEELEKALNAIQDSVGIGLVERIGLRYVDLVKLGPNETWTDYFNPGLLGLDRASLGVSQWISSQFVSQGRTELGVLVVRYTQSETPLPPDLHLLPVSLTFPGDLLNPGEVGTILDFDHYSELTCDFELEPVISAIGNLHDNVDRAFRNAVTPAALRKWE